MSGHVKSVEIQTSVSLDKVLSEHTQAQVCTRRLEQFPSRGRDGAAAKLKVVTVSQKGRGALS